MTALLINLKIDNLQKFNLFKITLKDLIGIFSEYHIKIRGNFKFEAIDYINILFKSYSNVLMYQNLPENDWISTTIQILKNINSTSIFLFCEDHKLIASSNDLRLLISEFENNKTDYICYSFYKASQLNTENILPLNPVYGSLYNSFILSNENIKLLGKISPRYYTYSLLSLCSKEYFENVLISKNKTIKIYSRTLSRLISFLFKYPLHINIEAIINKVLNPINIHYCFYDPSSPFNLETIWNRTNFLNRPLKFGVLTKEIYANFDDDNSSYGESLIKRGLYPFRENIYNGNFQNLKLGVKYKLSLTKGDKYNLTYFSRNSRINNPPVIRIIIITGTVEIKNQDLIINLTDGDIISLFSNKKPTIISLIDTKIELEFYDECF